MSGPDSNEGLDQVLYALRQAFDLSFTAPAEIEDARVEDMLALDIGSGRYAVRVSELSGVHPYRKVAVLPGGSPGLLGVAGIRGKLVAVFRLSDLIGADVRGTVEARLRWMLTCGPSSEVGLAIENLSAYVRAAPANLFSADERDVLGEHVREILLHNGVTRGVLSIPSILAAIMRRARQNPAGEGVSNG